MLEVVTVDEMLRLETEVLLPEHTLMRTAAFGLYIEILDIVRVTIGIAQGVKILGLIGPGNNGSDALWAMSFLSNHGFKVIAIDVTGKRTKGYADTLFDTSSGTWSSFTDARFDVDLILDGVAGLRNQYPPAKEVLEIIVNNPAALVVSVDMPSCFDNDAAAPIDPERVFYADYTITFGYLKNCHIFDPARTLCGEVRVVELPLNQPESVVAKLIEPSDIVDLLNRLDIDAHKYSHGVLGVIAGSDQYPGAGELTLAGSQWLGAGYIQFIGSDRTHSLSNVVRRATLADVHNKTNTIVFGPGVGVTENQKSNLKALLENSMTLILDADAITLLSENAELLETQRQRSAFTILTPHPAEAERLADALEIDTKQSVQLWVRDMAIKLNAIVCYKNAHGFVALPDGTFFVCNTTSSALATAGTGDVLAGLMGSLIARNSPENYSELGICAIGAIIIHSIAADLALQQGLFPTAIDIANQIPAATLILRDLYE